MAIEYSALDAYSIEDFYCDITRTFQGIVAVCWKTDNAFEVYPQKNEGFRSDMQDVTFSIAIKASFPEMPTIIRQM
jgi:hypothetical protein